MGVDGEVAIGNVEVYLKSSVSLIYQFCFKNDSLLVHKDLDFTQI